MQKLTKKKIGSPVISCVRKKASKTKKKVVSSPHEGKDGESWKTLISKLCVFYYSLSEKTKKLNNPLNNQKKILI